MNASERAELTRKNRGRLYNRTELESLVEDSIVDKVSDGIFSTYIRISDFSAEDVNAVIASLEKQGYVVKRNGGFLDVGWSDVK